MKDVQHIIIQVSIPFEIPYLTERRIMFRRLAFWTIVFILAVPAVVRGSSETISLDGTWRIAQDANNVGQNKAWFLNALADADEISVPGVLQEVYR